MTRRPEKTAAATRKARQGGGGFLGMEELSKLSGRLDTVSQRMRRPDKCCGQPNCVYCGKERP